MALTVLMAGVLAASLASPQTPKTLTLVDALRLAVPGRRLVRPALTPSAHRNSEISLLA